MIWWTFILAFEGTEACLRQLLM